MSSSTSSHLPIPATGDYHVRKRIVVGSRKSALAMIQSELVISELREFHPDIEFVIKTMDTTGDNIQNVPLAKIGEKALFTKELEHELLSGEIDIVVHSLKDLPTVLRENCCIAAITERESPDDALVFRKGFELPPGHENGSLETTFSQMTMIGTSSLRRIAQLKALGTSVDVKDVRGNLTTRFNKLDNHAEFGYDCLILAEAGLTRGGFESRISRRLDWYHAVSQGALGIECRTSDDYVINNLLAPLIHVQTLLECTAERAFLKFLEGGCSVPIGVRTTWIKPDLLQLKGIVLNLDGSRQFEAIEQITLTDDLAQNIAEFRLEDFSDITVRAIDEENIRRMKNCVILGRKLGQSLLDRGAGDVLNEIKRHINVK